MNGGWTMGRLGPMQCYLRKWHTKASWTAIVKRYWRRRENDGGLGWVMFITPSHPNVPRFFIPLPNYPPRHSLWLLSLFVLPTEHLEQNKHFCNTSVCLRKFGLPTWHSAIVLCQERQLTNSVMLNWIQDPSRANTPSVQGCINI